MSTPVADGGTPVLSVVEKHAQSAWIEAANMTAAASRAWAGLDQSREKELAESAENSLSITPDIGENVADGPDMERQHFLADLFGSYNKWAQFKNMAERSIFGLNHAAAMAERGAKRRCLPTDKNRRKTEAYLAAEVTCREAAEAWRMSAVWSYRALAAGGGKLQIRHE